MADYIQNLPAPTKRPTEQDVRVIHSVFGNPVDADKTLTDELKKLLAPALLYVLLNIPFTDNWLRNTIQPSNDYVYLAVKTSIFVVLLLLFQIFNWA